MYMKQVVISCELCSSPASLFCSSDSAFLCCSCDSLVHHANFLVARHVRHLLCSICHRFSGCALSGLNPPNSSSTTCPSCSPPTPSSREHLLLQDSFSSPSSTSSDTASSSVCSSTDGQEYRNNNPNRNRCKGAPPSLEDHSHFKATAAECIFVDWCSKLGVIADLGVVRTACRTQSLVVMPFRVCLAASVWVALRGKCCARRPRKTVLKRLEEVSGVPAKIILAAERRLVRALRQDRRRLLDLLAEGWAEC